MDNISFGTVVIATIIVTATYLIYTKILLPYREYTIYRNILTSNYKTNLSSLFKHKKTSERKQIPTSHTHISWEFQSCIVVWLPRFWKFCYFINNTFACCQEKCFTRAFHSHQLTIASYFANDCTLDVKRRPMNFNCFNFSDGIAKILKVVEKSINASQLALNDF